MVGIDQLLPFRGAQDLITNNLLSRGQRAGTSDFHIYFGVINTMRPRSSEN
jgi:hypothetical protein